MSWSVKGAENIAALVTKRACQRKVYEKFISRIMKDRNTKWEVNLHDGTGPNFRKSRARVGIISSPH